MQNKKIITQKKVMKGMITAEDMESIGFAFFRRFPQALEGLSYFKYFSISGVTSMFLNEKTRSIFI